VRLDWYVLPKHQKIIQADLYQGIMDTLAAREAHVVEARRRIVFPRGDQDVETKFLDDMTLG
jgi:hypothetical protein